VRITLFVVESYVVGVKLSGKDLQLLRVSDADSHVIPDLIGNPGSQLTTVLNPQSKRPADTTAG
jgi:hypothetical protein